MEPRLQDRQLLVLLRARAFAVGQVLLERVQRLLVPGKFGKPLLAVLPGRSSGQLKMPRGVFARMPDALHQEGQVPLRRRRLRDGVQAFVGKPAQQLAFHYLHLALAARLGDQHIAVEQRPSQQPAAIGKEIVGSGSVKNTAANAKAANHPVVLEDAVQSFAGRTRTSGSRFLITDRPGDKGSVRLSSPGASSSRASRARATPGHWQQWVSCASKIPAGFKHWTALRKSARAWA